MVEVAPDLSSVTIQGHSFPVKIVATSPTRVELEIDGERMVVDQWPDHFPQPPGPVDVSGERWNVTISAERGRPTTTPRPLPAAAEPLSSERSGVPAGEGIPIFPPMPGKVLDVRVKSGDPVRKGDVLLHVEAMKMSNEITSPADGVVRDVRVSAGANVRAKEPMLVVVPSPGS